MFDDDFCALHFNWLLQILDVCVVMIIITIIVVFLTATNIVVIRLCLIVINVIARIIAD